MKVDAYSGCGFAFLAHNAFPIVTICGLMECLIHQHAIPHVIFNRETHFTANEVRQWTCDPMIHRFYLLHYLYILHDPVAEAAG